MKAWAFLNINQVSIAWEVYCGQIISTNETITNSVRPMSVFESNRFRKNDVTWYTNELIIEEKRSQNHPSKTSRLTGMYFFEDKESALRATRDTRWGDGYYDEQFLSEVELIPMGDITRVDHNWIFEKEIPRNLIDQNDTDWIDRYWNGDAIINQEPLWELIIEGKAVILNEELKERAFKVIQEKHPQSLAMLELSKIARWGGSQYGHIISWVRPKSDHVGTVVYIINANKNSEEIIKKMKNYNGQINREILNENSEIRTPDLRSEAFDITIA